MKYPSPSLSGLKTIEKASVKDQTLEQLKNYILSGVARLGERLPSERALAEGGGTHQAIFDTIASGDADAAGDLMRDHIQFSSEVWQTVISLTADTDSDSTSDLPRGEW